MSNEEETVTRYNVEKAEILHKGKIFRIVIVPVVAKTREELNHWLHRMDDPQVMKEIIEKVMREFDNQEALADELQERAPRGAS